MQNLYLMNTSVSEHFLNSPNGVHYIEILLYIPMTRREKERKKENKELVSFSMLFFRHDMTKKGEIEEEKNKDRTVFLR